MNSSELGIPRFEQNPRISLTSTEPFKRLIRLTARAFYDDFTTKGDNLPRTGRSDNKGLAVVVLDALTRRQWVKEDDLAKDLKLHSKQLRRTLRYFEEEKLVTRDQRKETAKGAKFHSAAVAATGDGPTARGGDDKSKPHMHSYCCLDYSQIYDVVRYRIHKMKKKLKDELEDRNTIQEYLCPECKRRYSALDALRLISLEDEYFHCENCNSELIAESDKFAGEGIGEGDDNIRRRRREKLKDMLQRLEVQLKPLTDQIARVKDLPVPYFGSLQEWQAQAIAAGRATVDDPNENDLSRNSQAHLHGGIPMPTFGETRVEVSLSGLEAAEEESKPEAAVTGMKKLPPWMMKQDMLQRSEVKNETNLDTASTSNGKFEDKKMNDTNRESQQDIQEEYYKAYYYALLKRQQEAAAATSNGTPIDSERQVGMKAKREDDVDEVEWEEAQPTGSSNDVHKIQDLNIQAQESDEDEDDIDWEEG